MTDHNDGAFDGKGTESDLITDHKFVSRGQWWDLCKVCRLAQAAHAEAEHDVEDVIPKQKDRATFSYYGDGE